GGPAEGRWRRQSASGPQSMNAGRNVDSGRIGRRSLPAGGIRWRPERASVSRRKTSHRPFGEYEPRYAFVTPSWKWVSERRWEPSRRIVTMLAESSGSKWLAFSVTAVVTAFRA